MTTADPSDLRMKLSSMPFASTFTLTQPEGQQSRRVLS
jgi:hypothetical protein